MSNYHLTTEPREVIGRKVKTLRSRGLVPANVFGVKVASQTLQLTTADFLKVYEHAGDTGLIDLTIQGESKSRPVLVHEVQTHPVTGQLLHVDFRQVNLKEKLTAQVPVQLIGEAPAVAQGGILVQVLDTVEVEALPTDLPENIELDAISLTEIGHTLHVSDLKIDTSKLTLKEEPDTIIAKIEAPAAEEVEEKPTPETEFEHGGEQPEEGAEGEKTPDQSSEKPSGEKPAE